MSSSPKPVFSLSSLSAFESVTQDQQQDPERLLGGSKLCRSIVHLGSGLGEPWNHQSTIPNTVNIYQVPTWYNYLPIQQIFIRDPHPYHLKSILGHWVISDHLLRTRLVLRH